MMDNLYVTAELNIWRCKSKFILQLQQKQKICAGMKERSTNTTIPVNEIRGIKSKPKS
jgi:hypothetical protein